MAEQDVEQGDTLRWCREARALLAMRQPEAARAPAWQEALRELGPQMAQLRAAGEARVVQALDEVLLALERASPEAADALLGSLREYVAAETAELAREAPPEPQEGQFDTIGGLGGKKGEVFSAPLERLQRRPGDAEAAKRLEGLGLSREEEDELLLAERGAKGVVEAAALRLAELQPLKLPAGQRLPLVRLSETDPQAYQAALHALGALGDADCSAAAYAGLQKERIRLIEDGRQAELDMEALKEEVKEAGNAESQFDLALDDLKAEQVRLAKELEQARTRQPEDPGTIQDLVARGQRLTRKLELTGAEKGKASERMTELIRGFEPVSERIERAAAADQKFHADLAELNRKKDLLDALSFGALAPGRNPELKDEDRKRLIDAYRRSPAVALSGIELLGSGQAKPAQVLAALESVLVHREAGFADRHGTKPQLDKADLDLVAANALRQCARLGPTAVAEFDDYLAAGHQLEPDPGAGDKRIGSQGEGDTETYNRRVSARTGALAGAVIGPTGEPDFGSPGATAMLAHMKFHPGSLKTYTPQLTDTMLQVRELFADGELGPKARLALADVALPKADAPQADRARQLVSETMNRPPQDLGDRDVKAAVLSAMMTPLAQGPVGSCFATAPVRAIRETDPVRALEAYGKLASTGQFVTGDGRKLPAVNGPPKGENALMRSWEYSVAAAAADATGSREREALTQGMMGGSDGVRMLGSFGGLVGAKNNLNGIRAIVGDEAWAGSGSGSGLEDSIKGRLQQAVAQQLSYQYDASPPSGDRPSGGGDGSSTDGGYVLCHKGQPLRSQQEFTDAVCRLALEAAKTDESSKQGQAIRELVAKPDFVQSIIGSRKILGFGKDYKPWALNAGGYESQSLATLEGGAFEQESLLWSRTLGLASSRGRGLLDGLAGLAKAKAGEKMVPLVTSGQDANHAFNLLPSAELQALAGPDGSRIIEQDLERPGQAIARSVMPAELVDATYLQQLRAHQNELEPAGLKAMAAALEKPPGRPMTPGELKAYVAQALQPVLRVKTRKEAQDWADKQQKKPGEGELKARQEKLLGKAIEQADRALDAELAATLRPPYKVVADTNWGGPDGQELFVIAPDPSTGQLRLWKRNTQTGRLQPMGDNWADAAWSTAKPKT